MGKFRSKLKGAKKGKRWSKGQSSSSNPEIRKHRDVAKSRFFQENLGSSNLTLDAVRKHDVVQNLSSFKPVEMEEDVESSEASTYDTGNSFASEWSTCTSMSFGRFLRIFRSDSALHKDMLAILAAITEVIKERSGTESPTEYYCSLLTALEQVMSQQDPNEDQVTAILSLLNMGIKTVPEAVLRTGFDNVAKKMLMVLNAYANSENNIILKSLFGILAVLLKAQEVAVWTSSYTTQIFCAILNPFCIHTKPKWRKAAQYAVIVICSKNNNNIPADKVAEFCESILESSIATGGNKTGQTTILHVLGLMKDTISCFTKNHMKKSCEIILRLMTLNYPIVTSCGLQVLYALFSHQSSIVPAKLNGQLISALYDYQPGVTDVQPMLAWVTVMQQAHIHLADTDLPLACAALPKIFSVFTQLWLSQRVKITSCVTHALEALLRDAITPACQTEQTVDQHKLKLVKCFGAIESCLGYQYNVVWNQVIHIISVMFEVGGKNCAPIFLSTLKSLAELRDSYKFSYNNELEHAVGAAVRSIGPEIVLNVISLKKDNGEINVDRSWMLSVLKENIKVSTLGYWSQNILPLIIFCQNRSSELSKNNDGIGSHSYELMSLQLWHLLPSFCNKPTDIKDNFKNIAKILGTAVSDHKELRLAVMLSLRKLIIHAKESENVDDMAEITRFDKNYLPILFNLYTTKPNGTDEEGQRSAAFDTIKAYLPITKPELTEQLFENALERLQNSTEPTEASDIFAKESILDLIRTLVPYQNTSRIDKLYKQCIKMLPDIKNRKEQKKAYRLLEEICGSDAECCKEYLKNNRKSIQKLLLRALETAAVSSKGARLRCLNYLVKAQPQLNHESTLLRSVIPEAVICCKDINEKCRNAAFSLLNTIGEVLSKRNEVQQFITMIIAGLTATPQIMSATIVALASILHNFSGALGHENIQVILDNVCSLTTVPTREIVGSCLSFIKTFCTSLPSVVVAGSLPVIMKSLTKMTEDCKRHFRLKVRDILNRLVRKFGCDSLTPHIPTSDVVMYKRLRNLRKLNSRKKKRQDEEDEQDSHSEDEFTVNAKPKSIEDILADSDSDLEDLERDVHKRKPQRSTWIREDADTILDFTDPRMSNKITVTKPNVASNEPTSKLKKNHGFKTAPDGRLIIEDDSSSDSDQPKTKGFMKMEGSDTDDEDGGASTIKSQAILNKKRKRVDTESIKSGQTNKLSMKYKAGGSGIHRPISTSSVRSGFGSEYKAKKAGGDMKKKGKAEPYAYVPLKRSLLNKRKKAKMIGQFKNIGKAAKDGAKKGAKAKKIMKQRK